MKDRRGSRHGAWQGGDGHSMCTSEGDYPISKLATAFRDYTQEEFDGLKFSMAELGQTDPIILLGKEVFDGRHRLRACDELGITPLFEDLPDGVNPIRYLIAKNGSRRHRRPASGRSLRQSSPPGPGQAATGRASPTGKTIPQICGMIRTSRRSPGCSA